jgi:hypothetical protein
MAYGAAGAARRNKDLGRQLVIWRVGSGSAYPTAGLASGPSPNPWSWGLASWRIGRGGGQHLQRPALFGSKT